MKIIFMGTPEFSVPCLKILVDQGYEIPMVITQPDKPKGRGKKLCCPPIKEYALEHGLSVFQPIKVKTKSFTDLLIEASPDLIVTVAYGKILPLRVLNIPRLGCINVHASLLPKYRGAAPYQWAIINGEKVTGNTTMLMDEGMDTGDILLQKEVNIPEDMTAGELHDKLSIMGAELLKETLEGLKNGTLTPIPQDENMATYAPMLDKSIGEIKWGKSAVEIHNLVRGTNPWPGAFTHIDGKRMKIWKTEAMQMEDSNTLPGTILSVDKEGIVVKCGEGALRILEVQLDNCRRMVVEEYICGHKVNTGEILGKKER